MARSLQCHIFKNGGKLGMVPQAIIPSFKRRQQEDHKFEASLDYLVIQSQPKL